MPPDRLCLLAIDNERREEARSARFSVPHATACELPLQSLQRSRIAGYEFLENRSLERVELRPSLCHVLERVESALDEGLFVGGE